MQRWRPLPWCRWRCWHCEHGRAVLVSRSRVRRHTQICDVGRVRDGLLCDSSRRHALRRPLQSRPAARRGRRSRTRRAHALHAPAMRLHGQLVRITRCRGARRPILPPGARCALRARAFLYRRGKRRCSRRRCERAGGSQVGARVMELLNGEHFDAILKDVCPPPPPPPPLLLLLLPTATGGRSCVLYAC